MPDYKPSEEVLAVINRQYATRQELKKSLMRRAEEGRSVHTPEQIDLLIAWRLSSNNVTPQDQQVLDDINSFKLSDPPRSILMLDAFARHLEQIERAEKGKVTSRIRYEYNPATVPPPPSVQ